MSEPSNFILTSDFATLKNDAKDTLSVTLPSTLNIPANSAVTYSDIKAFGTNGASSRVRLMSTKDNDWHTLPYNEYLYNTGATVSGGSVGYSIYVAVSRVSSTEFQLKVYLANPYGATMSITSLSQTITAVVSSFIPPFI